MSKQTALTKAIEQLQTKIANLEIEKASKYAFMARAFLGNEIDNLKEYVQQLADLLPYEREVIEEAYGQGFGDRDSMVFHENPEFNSSTDYFTKTFTNGND